MKYYGRTLVAMAVVFLITAAAAFLANRMAADTKARYVLLAEHTRATRVRRAAQQQRIARLAQAIAPVREFSSAWSGFATVGEKNGAEKIRSEVEAIAQRQLGLVTDNAITPQPERYVFQGTPLHVQRVTLRASGKDLAALLAWLGKVEERFPAALIEHCEFSSNVGGNTGLTLRLVQPLDEGPSRRIPAAMSPQQVAVLPDGIAAVPWPLYLPQKVKAANAVGFQRNPLQPAVIGDGRTLPMLRDETDELTPKLEAALDGRVRSVIRGASPLVVVEGRIFRVGDELVIGSGREKPIPDTKTKLKHIGDDRLVFQVSGGTADRPIQCELAYALPSFLKAR